MSTKKMIRSYSELIRIGTFEDRFEYAKLRGFVGDSTFGSKRYLNQRFYHSKEWLDFKRKIIIRDEGCDLAFPTREINSRIYIHHLNPVTVDDILEERYDLILNENNVVCVSFDTHQAIHYSDEKILPKVISPRTPNDTCPWK